MVLLTLMGKFKSFDYILSEDESKP